MTPSMRTQGIWKLSATKRMLPQELFKLSDLAGDETSLKWELKKKSFALKFSSEVEPLFLGHYLRIAMGQIRATLLFGIFLFGIFGVLDFWMYPNALPRIWFIRFAVVCPILALVLVYSHYVKEEPRMQLAYCFGVLAAGAGVVAMMLLTQSQGTHMYYTGIILIVFFTHALTKIRFIYATVCCWLITLGYVVVTLQLGLEKPLLINNVFYLTAANILGMVASYLLEKYVRKDFLQTTLLEKTNRKLQLLSFMDSLTNVANRRCFDLFFDKEWNRAERQKYVISLLILDLDYFKRYNDRYGHLAGDECLARVARATSEFERRPGDLVARYGGEEFAVILSGTGLRDAQRIAEDLRKNIIRLKIPHQASDVAGVVTVSIGVSSVVPVEGLSRTELIDAADTALYQAKEKGRNRVVAMEPSEYASSGSEQAKGRVQRLA